MSRKIPSTDRFRQSLGISAKLGDQWESEAFHNMKLDAHGSILNSLRMVTGAWSVTVSLQPLARGMGHRENSPGAVSGSCQGRRFHTLSAAWDVNRKEWFDIFGKESRQPGDWGHWTGRGMVEHAVRVVPHVFVP